MSRSGRGSAALERRLNHGFQSLPSGIPAFPVARASEHHRSLLQRMPELWTDFSDRGLPHARAGTCERAAAFHGDLPEGGGPGEARDGAAAAAAASPAQSGRVLFVGCAEFDMDGRVHTAGEMDRLMQRAASSKYPCSRPATFDEYAEGAIVGLPARNATGHDVVFGGPGATGCELFHTNTLGAQKVVVPPGDAFDGTWGTASLFGRKCILCVHPVQRIRRQQSLTQFGLARNSLGRSGGLRRAGSVLSLPDKMRLTAGGLGGTSTQRVGDADRLPF